MYSKYIFFSPRSFLFLYKAKDLSVPSYHGRCLNREPQPTQPVSASVSFCSELILKLRHIPMSLLRFKPLIAVFEQTKVSL
jgi:hypothetical protein